MALSTGVLVAIVIVSIELLIIIVVIGYIIYNGQRLKRARENSDIKKDIEGDLESEKPDQAGNDNLGYDSDELPTKDDDHIGEPTNDEPLNTSKPRSTFEISSESSSDTAASPEKESRRSRRRRSTKTPTSPDVDESQQAAQEEVVEAVKEHHRKQKKELQEEIDHEEFPPPLPERDDEPDVAEDPELTSKDTAAAEEVNDKQPSSVDKEADEKDEAVESENPYQLSPVNVIPVLEAKLLEAEASPESIDSTTKSESKETADESPRDSSGNRVIEIPNTNIGVGEEPTPSNKEQSVDEGKINQMVEQLLHTVGNARSDLVETDGSKSLISDPAILDSLMQNAQITLSLTINNANKKEKPSVVVINSTSSSNELLNESKEQKSSDIEVVRKIGELHKEDQFTEEELNKSLHQDDDFPLPPPPIPKKTSAMDPVRTCQEEEIVAGVVNVTTGEKLTICNAAQKRLIPQPTANLLLEAQAAVGSMINPRNGVKLSVNDAIRLGLVDESYREALTAAEGAYYGYLDPRTNESVSLFTAMTREIFPKHKGKRLLEAQHASGGVVNPWTGERCSLEAAFEAGLIDSGNLENLRESQRTAQEECNVLDPDQNERITYHKILAKCIRDLDTGLKFLYIEEKPKVASIRYQPELLHFRSTFRQNVSLQELIDAGLVPNRTLDAFQSGRITKEELADILQSVLLGEDPIAGVVNKTTNQVYSISKAAQEGLIRPSTALELLEAQAATGAMIDPLTGKKMSVSKAFDTGLVNIRFIDALVKAEQAVHGYIERGSGRHISLFEAVKKGTVIEARWIRYLDAQLATGGLIDPRAGYRIPADIALDRRLLDRRVAEQLMQPQSKCFFSPLSGENVTYGELITKCIRSKKIKNLRLLPLTEKGPLVTMHKITNDVHQPNEVSVTRTISVGSHYPKQYVFTGSPDGTFTNNRTKSTDSDGSYFYR